MLSPEALILLIMLVMLAFWFLVNALFSFTGVWVKEADLVSEKISAHEQITLGQFGPFVVGRSELEGGYQSYSGLALGPKLWLRRRDYGISALVCQGFPAAIAADVEGQIMAKLRLNLGVHRTHMSGHFTPYKISFSYNPPKVTGVQLLPPKVRYYRRVEYIQAGFGQEIPIADNK